MCGVKMINKPEIGDVWIHNNIKCLIINVTKSFIEMVCMDTISLRVFYSKEFRVKADDNDESFSLFTKHYQYLGKSKLLKDMFDVSL